MKGLICAVVLCLGCAVAAAQEREWLGAAVRLSGAGSEEALEEAVRLSGSGADEWLEREWLTAAVRLSGAGSEEALEEQEVERYERLAARPLCINLARRSQLLSSGLFSSYQVASLLDYRARSGDILSAMELSLVDGFADVDALRYFVDFRPSVRQGIGDGRDSLEVGLDVMQRAAARRNGDASEACFGSKVCVALGSRGEIFLSARDTYAESVLGSGLSAASLACGAAYYGRKALGKVVVGDFNARFGQGLVLWSGFSMSGFSSAAGFARHPSGVSLSHSFTTPLRGVSADFIIGRTTISVVASVGSAGSRAVGSLTSFASSSAGDDLGSVGSKASVGSVGSAASSAVGDQASVTSVASRSATDALSSLASGAASGRGSYFIDVLALNGTWFGRRGQAGATVAYSSSKRSLSTSLDARASFGRFDFFGEVAGCYSGGGAAFAAVGGVTFNPSYGRRISLLGRVYPAVWSAPMAAGPRSSTKTSDEVGVALGVDWSSLTLTFDAAAHPSKGTRQFKALAAYSLDALPWLRLSPRATLRYRPQDGLPLRADVRLDTDLTLALVDSLRLPVRLHSDSLGRRAVRIVPMPPLNVRWRVEAVRCNEISALTYVEAGFKDQVSAYLRGSIFIVDNWDDRIYCYERDIPGSFTVPAYYGRGWSLSLICGRKWHFGSWTHAAASGVASAFGAAGSSGADQQSRYVRPSTLSLSLRASVVRYPSASSTRQDRAELKVQLSYSL